MSQQKSYAAALRGMTGEQRPLFLQLDGRGMTAGNGLGPSCPGGDDGRMTWTLAKPIFSFFSLLSPTGILSLFIRYNDLFAGKTDTPFSFLEGTNGE